MDYWRDTTEIHRAGESPDSPALMPLRQIGKAYYSAFVQPVKNRFGRKVGVITIFDDILGEQRVLHQSAANRDGFEPALGQTLANAFGDGCCAKWIKVRFCSLQGKDVCTVTVSPATGPIYPREKGKEEDTLYVRLGNTTRPLNPKEAVADARDRCNSSVLHRSYFRGLVVESAV